MRLPTTRFRAVGALFAGLILQAAPALADADRSTSAVLLVGSFTLLSAFALANIRVVGMWIVLLGLALNLAVIAANGAMPVKAGAIEAAGGDARELRGDAGHGHRLQREDDRLTVLADTLPIRAIGQVVSFGDLILAAGLVNVAFRLVLPLGPRPERRQASRRQVLRSAPPAAA